MTLARARIMGGGDGLALKEAFARILPVLMRIERGALFCLDRKFPWTMEMEDREGRALVAEAFAAFPGLASMMPQRAAALAQGRLLGDAGLASEIDAAREALGA